MKTLSFPDTWCGDCTPKESHVRLYPTGRPDPRIETSRGRVEILGEGTPKQNVLTLVCADIGETLCFAGPGGNDDLAWLWNGSRWISLVDKDGHPVITYAPSPCAFGEWGLYVSTPGLVDNIKLFDPLTGVHTSSLTKPLGSDGIASVEGLGVEGVHPQKEWYGHFGLGQYVITGGFAIGQGTGVHDGLQVAGKGMLIPSGLCQNNRVHHEGDQFATASWLSGEGRTVFLWPTRAELNALSSEPPITQPPKPEPPIPPVEPPVTDYLAINQRVRAKYPTPLGSRHWEFLVDLAQQTGTLLYEKPGGAHVLIPPLNVFVSMDVIGRGVLGDVWVDTLRDAEGQAVPIWDAHPNAGGTYIDVRGVVLPGTPGTGPGPGGQCEARVAELEAAVRQIRDIAAGVL